MVNYNQESKNKVRALMLESAITALTSKRHTSELIAQDELKVTFDHYLSLIKRWLGSGSTYNELHCAAQSELSEWMQFDIACNTPREACELKILYLCGPSPINDLQVLLEHGINIHNIWAVTSSTEDSAAAHRQLSDFNLALKIHEGSLAEFFEIYKRNIRSHLL